jgi:hypothetical protein
MKRTQEDTAARAEASQIAGAKGRSAAPMTARDRFVRYGDGQHALTPAQRRRLLKKQKYVLTAEIAGAR